MTPFSHMILCIIFFALGAIVGEMRYMRNLRKIATELDIMRKKIEGGVRHE
jgi:hypothetical protein